MEDMVPPPMGSLGNFKGVMLCNRPVDDAAKGRSATGNDGEQMPFRCAVSGRESEPLGLHPCKKFVPTVKKRGPSAALRRHVRWLRELQSQMQDERAQAEAEENQNEEAKQRVRKNYEKQREAVREMRLERDRVREPTGHGAAARDEATRELGKERKPLWAMTETEQEDYEDQEASDLISFAENLDYDKFVSDLEFRQGLEALRDRMGKIQKEQDAFKDALVRDFNAKCEEGEAESTCAGSLEDGIDGNGLLGDLRSEYSATSSQRPRGDERREGRPDWDASTNCGDDRPDVAKEVKSAAGRILQSVPQLRAIHSKESVQRIIEKTRDKQLPIEEDLELHEHMRREGPVPAPVIVASADTQTRLNRPVEPSQLPYLYRSPAV